MPYDSGNVLKQIRATAAEVQVKLVQQREALALAADLYHQACERIAEWKEIVEAGNDNRQCANPLLGSKEVVIPYPLTPAIPSDGYTVVATDSSFIEPDKHRGAFCHLINVGRVMIKYGEEQASLLESVTFHEPDYLRPIEERFVDFERVLQAECTAHEMAELYNLANQYRADIALFDGPLNQTALLLRNVRPISERVKASLSSYYELLNGFEGKPTLLVGCNSRTNSNWVMRSLQKAVGAGMFKGVTKQDPRVDIFSAYLDDGDLFSYALEPGTRSITFQPLNRKKRNLGEDRDSDSYEHKVETGMFYLSFSGKQGRTAERIDVPSWSLGEIDRVHRLLLSQYTLGDENPLALNVADKQAVLTRGEDRETYYTLLDMEGLLLSLSNKARSKREAGRNI